MFYSCKKKFIMYIQALSLNDAVIRLSKQLLEVGRWEVRGKNMAGNKCLEFPEPVLIEIENPTDRYVRVPERKWNKTLGWVESLWLAQGRNDMGLVDRYVKNMMNFSDDKLSMRAGYGPRLRAFGSNLFTMDYDGTLLKDQYQVGEGRLNFWKRHLTEKELCDQLMFCIEKFKEDLGTREAVITIPNPYADDFDNLGSVLKTKDTPCTRSIHFMVVDGKMNCYVDMRSNDLIWGFSAVNVFNFTFMQEYVAGLVGVPVGKYYHKADNLHIYTGGLDMVEAIAKNDIETHTERYTYPVDYSSLEEFDSKIGLVNSFEKSCCGADGDLPLSYRKGMAVLEDLFPYPSIFRDWCLIFLRKWTKKSVIFSNPLLNKLFA